MRGPNRESSLTREDYLTDEYFSYSQLWSFVEQIHQIRSFHAASLIEIGVGNGFVSTFLRSTGMRVKTFDINPNLQPDVVAPVQDVSRFVQPGEYDLISCCEVLEHLPFEEFEPVIRQFSQISNHLFLTLPVYGPKLGFGGSIQLAWVSRWVNAWMRMPARYPLPIMHFWEIDHSRQTRKKVIIELLRRYYMEIETGLFVGNPYHRFVKCKTSQSPLRTI